MSKVKQIEAEGQELVLRNDAGDVAIIPGKYRREVMDMLDDECYNCVDALVGTLPVMSDYAEDGTVIADDKPPYDDFAGMIVNMGLDTAHYDLRGYYDGLSEKAIAKMVKNGLDELPETYKMPGHPTFSTESKYSTEDNPGGQWDKQIRGGEEYWQFTPSIKNIEALGGVEKYKQWWQDNQQERVELNLNANLYKPEQKLIEVQ